MSFNHRGQALTSYKNQGYEMSNRSLFYHVIILLGFLVAGCSSGGNDASTNTQLSGVAASGAPLVGTVYLKDSSNPVKELSSPIAADGAFSFTLNGLNAPYLLKAVGTANGRTVTLYSFASVPGIANINPLTNLSLAEAYGNQDLATLYTAPTPHTMLFLANSLTGAVAAVKTALQPTLTKLGATNADFINAPFVANRQGIDLLFDMVDFSTGSGIVTITDKTDNSHKQFCIEHLSSSVLNLITVPIPAAGAIAIMPASKTLEPNAETTFTAVISGVSNQSLTWSVIEENGGTVTSNGLYRAPETQGTYHVKATSMVDSSKSAIATVTVKQRNVLMLVSSGNGVFDFRGSNLINLANAQLRITYNSAILSNPQVTADGLATGANLTTDTTVPGVLIITIGGKLIFGNGSFATIRFDVLNSSPGGIIMTAVTTGEGTPPALPIPCSSRTAAPIPSSTSSGTTSH